MLGVAKNSSTNYSIASNDVASKSPPIVVVTASGARVLPHGGSVFASGGPDLAFGFVVVFPETGVHGPLRLADVGGCTRVVDASGARDVVHH